MHAIDLSAKRILQAVSREEPEMARDYSGALAGLLDLRRHKLSASCPTCKGKGITRERRESPSVGSDILVPVGCPNRAHHF